MGRKKEDMVNEILAHFDFEKVHTVMKALNWTWYNEGIPNIQSLKESAESHMYSAIKQVLSPDNKEHREVAWQSASGGFKAMAWKTKKGKLARIQLEFIVSDWYTDNE